MTSLEFRDRLARRARRAKAPVTIAMLDPLEAYYRLLMRWNAKINLTALPLDPPTDETFDRLLVEPLAAAPHLGRSSGGRPVSNPQDWFDLGSGGGSPAIPLLVALPPLRLTMIEAKERKATFLREALRVVGLASRGSVVNERFEEAAESDNFAHSADLITVRAVRTDAQLFATASQLLKARGRLFLFRPPHDAMPDPPGFTHISTVPLVDSPATFLSSYRVFHVEQSG